MPQIAVINESTAISDPDVQRMIAAFEAQWNNDVRPIWGVDAANFIFVPRGQMPAVGTWWLVFLDDGDHADALGYYDLTNQDLPISKVFVKPIIGDNASVSVAASHVICEMAVDPWLNTAYQDSRGVFWAGEICDPVASDEYGYVVGDVLVTDFVTPNWFAPLQVQGPIDFRGHVRTAFEILSGGYAQKFDPQQGWQQVMGSEARRSWRAHVAPGSRRERRARQSKSRSWPQFFITHVVGGESLPDVQILTLPDYHDPGSISDLSELMGNLPGEVQSLPDTLQRDIPPTKYRDLIITVIEDAVRRKGMTSTPAAVYSYADTIVSTTELPTMNSPISGETLLHMASVAVPSAAFLAQFHSLDAGSISLYFLMIAGIRIVLGAADGISIALKEGLSSGLLAALLKWMGNPPTVEEQRKRSSPHRERH